MPRFVFDGFRLEADGTLFRGEALVHLPPKELAALRLLLAHAGQIVTPLQLKQALWGEVHVTTDSVPKCLSSLRARLEPDACIQTIYKRGYRLSAQVRTQSALPRLAILPFATEYGVPEHLGSTLAEGTMARLTGARHRFVSILAQDSVFTLARRGLTAHQVGQALKADMVLAGTLRALPSHFRLRAEMIRVADGTQIWVEDLLVEQSRIGGLESELVSRLAFRMGSELPAGHSDRPSSRDGLVAEQEDAPRSREAYETFQRAHYEWQTLQRHRMQDGLQHLTRATELNPSLIPARVDLVNLSVTQAFYGYMPPAAAADLVRRTAKAIPDLSVRAQAMLPALGWVSFHADHNLNAALSAFSLSAHLPHNPWITRARSMFALSRHRFAETIELLSAAIHQDPYSPWLQARLAWTLHLAGQAEASVEQTEKTLALFPDHGGTNLYGAAILAYNGKAARGTRIAQDLARRLPFFDLATAVHAYTLACEGRSDEARGILERLQWLSRERFVLSSFTPAAYVALGQHDAALAELRNSAEARCPWFFQMLADPRLKPLHGRPEFDKLCAILPRMESATEHTEDLEP